MLTENDCIRVVSLNIGVATNINPQGQRPVLSGIAKQSVGDDLVSLTELGLKGDVQVNLKVHGGERRAVYVYPSEHYALWREELGQDLEPGSFGENVTSEGALEGDIRIGDVFLWGNTAVCVTEPREPCSKLNLYRGVPDMIERMQANGRCGWYLQVLAPGSVYRNAPMMLKGREEGTPTVAEAFRAKFAQS